MLVPLTLIVVAMILKKIPHLQMWVIVLILWSLGIAAGIIFEFAEELERSIAKGFIQGTLAAGLALVYGKAMKSSDE